MFYERLASKDVQVFENLRQHFWKNVLLRNIKEKKKPFCFVLFFGRVCVRACVRGFVGMMCVHTWDARTKFGNVGIMCVHT